MGNLDCICSINNCNIINCFKENKKNLNEITDLFKKEFKKVQKKTFEIAEKELKGLINAKFYDLRSREEFNLVDNCPKYIYFNSLEMLIIKIIYILEMQSIASDPDLYERNFHQLIFDKDIEEILAIIKEEQNLNKNEVEFIEGEELKTLDKFRNCNIKKYKFITIPYIEMEIFLNFHKEIEYLIDNVKREKIKIIENDVEKYYYPLQCLQTKEIFGVNKRIKQMSPD